MKSRRAGRKNGAAGTQDRALKTRIAGDQDEFLARLAHELRNPLAPIKMAAMLARSNCNCAGSHRYLDMIERQADNLTRLLDDLIDEPRPNGKPARNGGRIARHSTATPALAGPVRPGHRVLIVDDNADAGEALQDLLVSAGHEVRHVRDGRSALRAMRDFAPAVVLLDLCMPRMDGYEVARRIRARHPDVRLIAVTGYSQPHHQRHAVEVGITYLLVKPVRMDALARVLRGVFSTNGTHPPRGRDGLTSGAPPA